MDLWIRSQDKECLVKSKIIKYQKVNKEEYVICINGLIRGTYKTKERALEILDEIQEKLYGRNYDFIPDINLVLRDYLSPTIYEMPEE